MKTTRHYAVAVDGEQKPEWGDLSWIETTAGEDKDSIEIGRNSSGIITYGVKCYGEGDLLKLLERAVAIEHKLAELYPAVKRGEEKAK